MSADKIKSANTSREWGSLNPPLDPWILDAMASLGYQRMTPVQAATIPYFDFGSFKDLVVEAVTGSGKTLAFLIPVIRRLLRETTKKHHVASIIVSPTRELADQTYEVLNRLLGFHEVSAAAIRRIARVGDGESSDDEASANPNFPSSTPKAMPQLLVGGMNTTAQDLKFFLDNSPNILVGTPGRLVELLSSPHVHCPQSSFEVLVLDEADRLLDLGFKEDLQKILSKLPKQRRTGLFSASVSEAVDQLVRVGLRNPIKVTVRVKGGSGGEIEQITPASLKMRYIVTSASQKIPALVKLLKSMNPTPAKAIVYLSTCAAVDYFQHLLPTILDSTREQFLVVPLHGKHNPNVRLKNFSRFTSSIIPSILLTTDVAARGLDIPQVDLVTQIDPPTDPKVFLHRCGRAGRAGRKGLSVIFLRPGREEDYIPFLEIRKTPVTALEKPIVTVSDEEASATTKAIRDLVLADRGVHDKAQRAFVSWVQAYSKHQASSIFRLADIDWMDTGNAWGLLKLPKMPELKNWEGDKSLGLDIDFSSYAYKDKQREKLRVKGDKYSRQSNEEGHLEKHASKGTKRAWSQKLDEKDEREKRRTKRRAKRQRENWEKMTPEERHKQKELERLIGEVKSQQLEDQEFNGFDD